MVLDYVLLVLISKVDTPNSKVRVTSSIGRAKKACIDKQGTLIGRELTQTPLLLLPKYQVHKASLYLGTIILLFVLFPLSLRYEKREGHISLTQNA